MSKKNSPLGREAVDIADTVIVGLRGIHADAKDSVKMAGLSAALFLVGKTMGLSPSEVAMGLMICSTSTEAAFAELEEAGVTI